MKPLPPAEHTESEYCDLRKQIPAVSWTHWAMSWDPAALARPAEFANGSNREVIADGRFDFSDQSEQFAMIYCVSIRVPLFKRLVGFFTVDENTTHVRLRVAGAGLSLYEGSPGFDSLNPIVPPTTLNRSSCDPLRSF